MAGKSKSSSKKQAPATDSAPPVRKKSPVTSSAGPGAGERIPSIPKEVSLLIDDRIRSLGDWRGEMLGKVRRLIHEADPQIVEEWKWNGTPVWSHAGIICTGVTYQQIVKLTFARGAALDDPQRLFNSSLGGNTRRAIDLREGNKLPVRTFKSLIRAAVKENLQRAREKSPPRSKRRPGADDVAAGSGE